MLQIQNETEIPITAMRIQINYVDSNANRRRATLEVNNVLHGREKIQLNTNIGPLSSLKNVEAKILGASVAEKT
jgi:hypothetical protein